MVFGTATFFLKDDAKNATLDGYIQDYGYKMVEYYNINEKLFKLLKADNALMETLTGGIYINGGRPKNSVKEDIIINCLTVTRDSPQTAISNINIHVPDINVNINETPQFVPDFERLKELMQLVINCILNAKFEGILGEITSVTDMAEVMKEEHYVNIRINWLIAEKQI
jgi:hypothetical protein